MLTTASLSKDLTPGGGDILQGLWKTLLEALTGGTFAPLSKVHNKRMNSGMLKLKFTGKPPSMESPGPQSVPGAWPTACLVSGSSLLLHAELPDPFWFAPQILRAAFSCLPLPGLLPTWWPLPSHSLQPWFGHTLLIVFHNQVGPLQKVNPPIAFVPRNLFFFWGAPGMQESIRGNTHATGVLEQLDLEGGDEFSQAHYLGKPQRAAVISILTWFGQHTLMGKENNTISIIMVQ